jgi:8-oxo-dGTP pyrophosphatase MutT (NUDIX family)
MIQKVIAYITRRRISAPRELLVFAHQGMPDVPIQVPAGSIDSDESPETALFREIWEESGLTMLRLERKLGVCELMQDGKARQQHYFLLEATTALPEAWNHTVQGLGLDAGLIFSYFWAPIEPGFELYQGQTAFLNADAVPELFEAKPSSDDPSS